MKKFCSVFMRCFMLLALALPWAASAHAKSSGPSIVYDPISGEVLSQHRAGETWYPASLTKLMTAYVAFRAVAAGKMKLDHKLVMTPRASSQPPSKLGLPVGASIELGLAVQTLLVRSTNDLAVAIAEGVSGSVEDFARDMNATAKDIGMTSSNFVNPHGLPDPRQITTARDMAVLAGRLIREFPQYRHYYPARTVKVGKRTVRNLNGSYLNAWDAADGMKTGYICNSGFNLVASATVNGHTLVSVVLGAMNGGQRAVKAVGILKAAFGQIREPDDFDALHGWRPGVSGISIDDVKNNVISADRPPVDMRRKVCSYLPAWRTVRPYRLRRKWTATFGWFADPREGYELLTDRLMRTLDVFDGGRHGLIELHPKQGYLAAIGNLGKEQADGLCRLLKAKSQDCNVLPPDYMNTLAMVDNVIAAEREAVRLKAKKSKRAEKRRAKKRHAKKRRAKKAKSKRKKKRRRKSSK